MNLSPSAPVASDPKPTTLEPQSMSGIDTDKLFDEYEGKVDNKPVEGVVPAQPVLPYNQPKPEEEEPAEPSKEDTKTTDSKDNTEENEEGYYVDELEEEPTTPPAPQPEAPAAGLTPLQQYLVSQIQPLTITGKVGDQPVSVRAYTDEDLPAGFEYSDSISQRQFEKAFNRIDAQSVVLTDRFNNQQAQAQAQEQNQKFTTQERNDIRTDIGRLQREGLLPTFTPGMPIDEDPKAVDAQAALDFYEKEKTRAIRESNAGNRLLHLPSYYDSFKLWKAEQGGATTEDQKAEDSERKTISRRVARGQKQGGSSEGFQRLNIPREASFDEVINAYYPG